MFCNNCGQQNPDGVRFCSNCGAPMPVAEVPVAAAPVQTAPVEQPVQAPVQQPIQQPVYQAPAEQYAPVQQYVEPKKSNGKLIAIIVAIVVVIGLVVGGIFLFGDELGITGGDKEGSSEAGENGIANTPEAVTEKFFKAMMGYDAKALVDCLPDFMLEEYADELDCSANRNTIAAELAKTIPENAKKRKVSNLKIERVEDWDEVEETLSEIEEYFGSDAAKKVSDVCLVEVSATVDGEEGSEEYLVVKENGKWRVAEDN